ncbi:hypothetical protein [Microbacterium sp. LWO13-1.2]|uniref:hypothetical protein n=1 Tax=Microbacterium sp. LWO13-1.2 TaxID=3135262 RepID=UPI003139075B
MMDSLLDDAATIAALRALRPDGDTEEDIARAAWSLIAEPGDGVAGALIADLGAGAALRFALDGEHGTDRLPAATERTSRALAEARARWRPRADLRAVGDVLRAAGHVGAALLVPGDAQWPTALDELGDHAPSVLWVRGDPGLLTAGPRYW